MRSFAELFAPLSEPARRRSRQAALAEAPRLPHSPGDVWIFGYGSLLWDAPFPQQQASPARLTGWRRAMCVWSALARGTPALPGLSLGLVPGGACDGIALRIAAEDLDAVMPRIWQREMWTDIYKPTWVSLAIDGAAVAALTFTVNDASRQFTGDLSQAQVVEHITLAQGERGPCRDYLANTVAKLQSMGIKDRYLEDLDDAVAAAARRADLRHDE
ncbi:MAG: gamma-glutamylcyclotransferase [Alphaproteobacteria bacterium]|nr:gamma-glutamylcyclotransferase [Alphaproteobacteria bacterium]